MTFHEIKTLCDQMLIGQLSTADDVKFVPKSARALKIAISALEQTANAFPEDSATAWAMRDTLTAIEKVFTP